MNELLQNTPFLITCSIILLLAIWAISAEKRIGKRNKRIEALCLECNSERKAKFKQIEERIFAEKECRELALRRDRLEEILVKVCPYSRLQLYDDKRFESWLTKLRNPPKKGKSIKKPVKV